MKTRLLLATLTAATLMSSFAVAHAATRQYEPTHILLSEGLITSPEHTTAVDPSSGQITSFMPIYYAMEVLKRLGITSNWDGTAWSLTVPSSLHPDLSSPSTATNEMYFVMNGIRVEAAPKLVAVDPSSHQDTTFVPIYYLEQALKRIGITSTWDGTTWGMNQTSAAVTQSNMATAMWNTFTSVSWDINSHPSMGDVGITPSSTVPITAGQVATWLSQWAAKAKGVTPTWGPKKGQYVPYSLQYEVSSDPYTWASINGLFQGTSVTSASSDISQAEASTITSNLQWWLTGDRVINGVHHLHVPFYSNYLGWYAQLTGNKVTLVNYQNGMAQATQYYDEITVKQSETNLDMTVPNTSLSSFKLAWDIVDGYWEYGGWQASDNRGGKTIVIPNKGTFGPSIGLSSLIPTLYLQGYSIMFKNINGQPAFSQPYNIDLNQTP